MIPLRDVIPSRTTPYVTIGLIVVNVLVFLYEMTLTGPYLEEFVLYFGLVPAAFAWVAVLTSMFVHGGVLHVGMNMLFLWIFGDNVEDRMGHGRFLVFYLLCGVAAALAQAAMNPDSITAMVGASGAVAGVMGAYLVLYPRVRVYCLVPIGIIPISIALPAWTMLLYWAGIQFVSGLFGMMGGQDEGGVAFWAHIGGFVAGVVLIKVFARPEDVRAHRSEHWEPRRVAARW